MSYLLKYSKNGQANFSSLRPHRIEGGYTQDIHARASARTSHGDPATARSGSSRQRGPRNNNAGRGHVASPRAPNNGWQINTSYKQQTTSPTQHGPKKHRVRASPTLRLSAARVSGRQRCRAGCPAGCPVRVCWSGCAVEAWRVLWGAGGQICRPSFSKREFNHVDVFSLFSRLNTLLFFKFEKRTPRIHTVGRSYRTVGIYLKCNVGTGIGTYTCDSKKKWRCVVHVHSSTQYTASICSLLTSRRVCV